MDHGKYMRMAMAKAEEGDAPYGAVIVLNNQVLAAGFNTVRRDRDPSAHGEMNAIRAACRELGAANLEGCTLYTNVEPCPMCAAAALAANISRIVYGASMEEVSEFVPLLRMSCRELASHSGKRMEIIGGVLADLCLVPFRLRNQK